MTKQRLTNRLRVLRAERRITQIDLATDADIAMYRYWRIENGYIAPTVEEKRRMARVLRCQVADAFPVDPTGATSAA